MEKDIGEAKVRGDAHTQHFKHAQALIDMLTYAIKARARTHTHTLKANCVKYGLIRQPVWD